MKENNNCTAEIEEGKMIKEFSFNGMKFINNEENNSSFFIKTVLPTLAGTSIGRIHVYDQYMDFMKVHDQREKSLEKNGAKDLKFILLEIALQKISNGEIPHEKMPITPFGNLPKRFLDYASAPGHQGCEQQPLSFSSYEFLKQQLINCCCAEEGNKFAEIVANHAKKIAWGILQNLTPKGEPRDGFIFGENGWTPDGKEFRKLALEALKESCSEEELADFLKVGHWEEHMEFFSLLYKKDPENKVFKELYTQYRKSVKGNKRGLNTKFNAALKSGDATKLFE